MHRPPVGLRRRTAIVGGQFQGSWSAIELLPPVGQLALQSLSVQSLGLPDGEVSVLNGQPGKRRGLPLTESAVEAGELPKQEIYGPAIRGNVMYYQEQDMIIISQVQ